MAHLSRSDEREQTVTDVLLDTVDCPEDGDQVLIVDDTTGRLDLLDGKGAILHRWARYGVSAQSWPEGGPFDMATLRLNRDRDAFDMSLHAVLSLLKPGGSLWIYGANDEGMKSLPKRLKTLVESCELVDMRRRCRVLRVERPALIPSLRVSISQWARDLELPLPSGTRAWKSYPGLFAKGSLDPATEALMRVLPTPSAGSRVLDFASGPGALSAELIAREPNLRLAMLDHDALALTAARENVPGASYLQSNSWHRPPGRHRWDLIVSNPPVHKGRSQNLEVLEDLIAGAPMRLSQGGSLWFVALGHLPVTAMVEDAFDDRVSIAWQGPRFKVWHCQTSDEQEPSTSSWS